MKNLLLTLATTTAMATTAQAATVTDTTGAPLGGSRCMACSTNIGIGQTWLSTATGAVTQMEVWLTPLFGSNMGDIDLVVRDYLSSAILASTSVSRDDFLAPGSGDQSVVVDFSTLGLNVTDGTEYALEVISGEGNPFSWSRTGTSSYAGVWYDILPEGNSSPSTFQDFALDVTVDVAPVPLPASALLMLAAMGGLAVARRRAA